MKNKFALCFRPVVVETETEKENRDCNRNTVDDHHHLDDAKMIESRSILKGSKRSYSFSDVNRISTQPSTPRHDRLRRRNSASRKTAGTISSAWKTLFRTSSPKVVPKGSGEFGEQSEHIGIKKNKGSKDTNSSKNQIMYSKSSSSGSSSSTTTSSHVTSPSSSTSSSMNSSEMNHNTNEVSNLKRSILARSNSTSNSTTNKKPKTTKARDNIALKSSSYKGNQEGFVFYLVVLALAFNMICGLVYAIVLTSLSLYFIGRHRTHQRPVNALKLAELRKSRRKTMFHV